MSAQKKAGRPRVSIDLEELRKLAAMQCTGEEISRWFLLGHATWDRYAVREPYRSIIEHGRAMGKISVRRRQYDMAMAGDKTMCIWLGKQWLGQRDNVDAVITGANGPLEVEISLTAKESLTRRIASIAARASLEGSVSAAE